MRVRIGFRITDFFSDILLNFSKKILLIFLGENSTDFFSPLGFRTTQSSCYSFIFHSFLYLCEKFRRSFKKKIKNL